jgi:hypothetical protein
MYSKTTFRCWQILIWVCLPLFFQAQNPNWPAPNPAQYTYSANVIASITLDGLGVHHQNDRVAFFVGNEIRGLSSPVTLDGQNYLHFVTVYAGSNQLPMQIKVYNSATNTVYTSTNTYIFTVQGMTGTLNQPYVIQTFSANDAPISLDSIPLQTTLQETAFPELNLSSYLNQTDTDLISWTAFPNPNLMVTIDGSMLKVAPKSGFFGKTKLAVRATEMTPLAQSASAFIDLQVVANDALPSLRSLPGMGIEFGDAFVNICTGSDSLFNLRDFEMQYPGDCLEFDYLPVLENDPNPDARPAWSVDPTSYALNMTVNAKVLFTPTYELNDSDDLLGAFIGGQLRGVASPTVTAEGIYYFLTIYSNVGSGQIELKYYSDERKKILTNIQGLSFTPYTSIATPDDPLILDVCPIEPMIDAQGTVAMAIRDSLWTGDQPFKFIVMDCDFPELMMDMEVARFCVTSTVSDLTYHYRDLDGDGFGDANHFTRNCTQALGYVSKGLDCDDSDEQRYPGSPIPCGKNLTIYLDTVYEAFITTALMDAERTGLCGLDTSYLAQTDFACADVGDKLVKLTVIDRNGNIDTVYRVVTTIDTITKAIIKRKTFCSYIQLFSPNAGISVAARDRTLLWSTGESTDTILVYETGRYDLNVTVAAGCSKDALINVVISDCAAPPVVTLNAITQPTCDPPALGRQMLGTLPDGLWTLFQTGTEERCTEGTGPDYQVTELDTNGEKPGIYRFRVADPFACCSEWTNPFGVLMVRW